MSEYMRYITAIPMQQSLQSQNGSRMRSATPQPSPSHGNSSRIKHSFRDDYIPRQEAGI